MNETQKRIAHYTKILPKMKERIIAVALLLAISIAMATTVSFAWLVLSKAPEVTGVSTTIAANGNLEIALATGNRDTLTAPGASQVGDSKLELLRRNVTWGNLINLTDPAYGLDNLVLRPAQLNDTALLTSPLYGAVYSADGRIEKLTSNFSYTAWVPAQGTIPAHFGISNQLGVRAISSIKRELMGFQGEYVAMREAAAVANVLAGNAFIKITENTDWMNSLAIMMGTHMTATLNYEEQYINASVKQEDIENLIAMYDAFIEAYKLEAQAMANSLNMQQYLAWGGDKTKYTPITDTEILATTITTNDYTLSANGKILKISNLKRFIADYKMLNTDLEALKVISAGGDYRWTASGLKTIIAHLVDINKCMVDGQTVTALMNSFTSNPVSALGYRNKEVSCVITNGVLYNFEQRVGTTMKVSPNSNGKTGLPVTAKMYVNTMNLGEQVATIYATITTSATKPAEYTQDLTYGDSLNTGADDEAGDAVAQDTYGLAVDFWVRTNAQSTYLILEGNVLTREEERDAMGKDSNGQEVNLYTLTRTETIENEDGSTGSVPITYDLYQVTTKNDAGEDVVTWYLHDNHSVFTMEEGDPAPVQKKETITIVTGYEGENRVWDNNALLNPDATTQGTGSCYVYYADTPEDQARSLRLLEAFNIAFVDQDGKLLATAKMDTEHYFAESGRVTVPLVLEDSAIKLDETQYAITALEKNVPMLVTALVYLDGTQLTNDEVLAAADIQGQLNIQFGSSADLNAVQNEELATKERSVSASVSKTTFDYDTATEPMTTTVTVNVTGDQPSTVTAFFLRRINDAQGSREEVMTFTKGEGGTWTADHTFTSPGNYVLRSVMLDGVEYDLPMSDATPLPEVTVTGFTIKSLLVQKANNARHVDIMTAAGSSSVNVSLSFATNDPDKMPSSVAGRFLREDGTAANIAFTYNPTTGMWEGKTTFVTSGDYTLRYLVLNGEYVELPDTLWHTATVNLGMKVAVYTTSPTTFLYKPGDWKDDDGNLTEEGLKKTNLGMQVIIMNNAGDEMLGLSGVKLRYGKTGTGVAAKGFDVDLTWNAASGYYEGNFLSKVGMYSFLNVSVGSNTITNATISPSFMIISPEPPVFEEDVSAAYQFVPERNAAMKVYIKNCEAATVNAILSHSTNSGTKEVTVPGTLSAINEESAVATWVFNLPKDQAQDGVWTIKELRLSDVYDTDGTEYTAENPLIFDLTGKAVSSKVVETVKVTISSLSNKEFGKTNGAVTASFMTQHTLPGLTVVITDYNGDPIGVTKADGTFTSYVSDVKMSYTYGNDSATYGGYTSASLTAAVANFAMQLNPQADNKTFSGAPVTVQYAGSYSPTLTFSVSSNGNQTVTVTRTAENMGDSAPSFTVSSVTPSVKITAAHYASKSGGNSTFTNGETTVYYKEGTETSCGITYYNYTPADVTLTLSGYGNATSAWMNFTTSNSDGKVHLYEASQKDDGTSTNQYTWSGNGTCIRYMGWWESKTGTDEKAPAGTLTTKSLVLTHGKIEFTVPITIIINNPN